LLLCDQANLVGTAAYLWLWGYPILATANSFGGGAVTATPLSYVNAFRHK